MIKTVLKTATVTATIAGATFLAAPAHADTHTRTHTHTQNSNKGKAVHNTVNFILIGGYGVTCGTVSVAGQAGTACDNNHIRNHGNRNFSGREYRDDDDGYYDYDGER
ncbi:hypothetical protein AB0L06_06175 [Spirillospora sp. NPDC052269]